MRHCRRITSPTADNCTCDDCQQEAMAIHQLAHGITSIVNALIEYPALLEWGDGRGGWISELLRREMERVGLECDMEFQPPRREVVRLGERDGWVCAYCSVRLYGDPDLPRPHVDHVIPKSRGGSNSLSNKVLACPTCNMSKGARTPEEWRAGR